MVCPFSTRGPVPLISCTRRRSSVGSGVSVKSKPVMTPFLNFGLGIQSGCRRLLALRLVQHLGHQVDDDEDGVLVADAELGVAGRAERLLGRRGDRDPRADLGVLDAGQELGELVVDREQLGLLLVVGAERRLLGVAVADPQVRQHVVLVLQLLAVALGEGLGLDLAGVHRALPLHVGRRAHVTGDRDRVQPVVGLAAEQRVPRGGVVAARRQEQRAAGEQRGDQDQVWDDVDEARRNPNGRG